MIFIDIPSGASVFLDANVFIFHLGRHAALHAPCQQLLERISRGDLVGFTSSDVLSDVAHRVMAIEASNVYGWPMIGFSAIRSNCRV